MDRLKIYRYSWVILQGLLYNSSTARRRLCSEFGWSSTCGFLLHMSTESSDLSDPSLVTSLSTESRESSSSGNEGVVSVEALVAVGVQLVEQLACYQGSHSAIRSGCDAHRWRRGSSRRSCSGSSYSAGVTQLQQLQQEKRNHRD